MGTHPENKNFSRKEKVWAHKEKRNKRNKSGVEEKKKTQGDEKGFSTFLWRVYYFGWCGPSPLLLFSFSHHFGWCVFWEGENWMTKMLENWEVGDRARES